MISASQLYDFVHCPHRVSMDAFADAAERDETSPFVELLWEQGIVHENAIAEVLKITATMKTIDLADRERETLTAMARHEPLIYGGSIFAGDLSGEPDLLEWTGRGYIPGDIKSGSGFEGDESEGKLKKHYAFQLAHYMFILEQLGLADRARSPYIVDREGICVLEPIGETKVRANSKSTMHSSLRTICSFSSNWDSQIEPAAPTSLTARVSVSWSRSERRK